MMDSSALPIPKATSDMMMKKVTLMLLLPGLGPGTSSSTSVKMKRWFSTVIIMHCQGSSLQGFNKVDAGVWPRIGKGTTWWEEGTCHNGYGINWDKRPDLQCVCVGISWKGWWSADWMGSRYTLLILSSTQRCIGICWKRGWDGLIFYIIVICINIRSDHGKWMIIIIMIVLWIERNASHRIFRIEWNGREYGSIEDSLYFREVTAG